jgi:hypothetical protein
MKLAMWNTHPPVVEQMISLGGAGIGESLHILCCCRPSHFNQCIVGGTDGKGSVSEIEHFDF